eukprot:4934002-Ditylum_brightwellii.AAC.1
MGLSTTQLQALSQEGLATKEVFVIFNEDQLKVAFKNAHSGIPGQPAIAAVANAAGDETQSAVFAIPGVPAVPIPATCAS